MTHTLAFAALALLLAGCMSPGQYVSEDGRELRNNCLVQSMCLDLPANRPGASSSFFYYWSR